MSIDDEDVWVICGYDGVDLCETCWVCIGCRPSVPVNGGGLLDHVG